ncbi:MAG TPA: ABC transporter permease [Actinomycetota bacterium]|nr:ABC transporter permease [Actinomycetota bacterium]
MSRYLLRRVALAVLVVVGVVVLTFVIARVIPGDPAASWAGPHASRQEIAQVRTELGLDLPLPQQILRYFSGVLRGNWGTSIHTHQPVLSDIMDRAPASIELVVTAIVIALVVGLPLGLASARWAHRAPDGLIRIGAVFAVSMPAFWLALILQLVFFQRLHVLPVAGQYDPNLDYTHPLTQYTRMVVVDSLITANWAVLRSGLSHLVLPALVVASYPFGVITRMVRGSELDTLGEDHVRATRALGFPERAIFGRFALKPALVPVVSVIALVFAYSLVNTFLVETIFDWPGLGSYAADSISSLDTPAIVGITLFIAVIYVIANLIVDLVQAWVDPRIALS